MELLIMMAIVCGFLGLIFVFRKKDTNNVKNNEEDTISHYGDFILYLNKRVKFNDLAKFFAKYNFDINAEVGDDYNIYIISKDSKSGMGTECYVTGMEYKEDLLDFENDLNEEDSEDEENWKSNIESMKKFDSHCLIDVKSEIEFKYMILLTLYIYEKDGDVLLYGCYDGKYLGPSELKKLWELIK